MNTKRIKLAIISPKANGYFDETYRRDLLRNDIDVILPILFEKTLSKEFNRMDISFYSTELTERLKVGSYILLEVDSDEPNNDNINIAKAEVYILTNSSLQVTTLKDPRHENKTVYLHKISIAEPLFLWRNVHLENLAFTRLDEVTTYDLSGNVTVVPEEEITTTIDLVINRVLKLAGDYPHNNSWYNFVDVVFTAKQQSRISEIGNINISFEHETLWSAIVKIGGLFNAIPKLKINYEAPTGVKPFTLSFIDTDGNSDTPIEWEEFIKNYKSWEETEDEYQGVGHVVTNLSNVALDDIQKMPIIHTDETKLENILINDEITLPFPVLKVQYLEVKLRGSSLDNLVMAHAKIGMLPKEEWESSPQAVKNSTGYFEKGGNVIHITNSAIHKGIQKYIGDAEDRVAYTTHSVDVIYDAESKRVLIGQRTSTSTPASSFNGSGPVNRHPIISNLHLQFFVQIVYFPYFDVSIFGNINGNNQPDFLMEEVSQDASDNNLRAAFSSFNNYIDEAYGSDLTVNKVCSKYSEIVPVGTKIRKNNENFVVTTANMKIYPTYIDVVYLINKNRVKRSELVSLNQSDYGKVPGALKEVERSINIYEKAKVGLSLYEPVQTSDNNLSIESYYLSPLHANEKCLGVVEVRNNDKNTLDTASAISYTFGNSFLFTIVFRSNLNIRNFNNNTKITDAFGRINSLSIIGHVYYYTLVNNIIKPQTFRYNPNYETPYFLLGNCALSSNNSFDLIFLGQLADRESDLSHGYGYTEEYGLLHKRRNLPYDWLGQYQRAHRFVYADEEPQEIVMHRAFNILKDSSEKLSITYQLSVQPDSRTIISKDFTKVHAWANKNTKQDFYIAASDELLDDLNEETMTTVDWGDEIPLTIYEVEANVEHGKAKITTKDSVLLIGRYVYLLYKTNTGNYKIFLATKISDSVETFTTV